MQVIMNKYIIFIAIWCLVLNTYIVYTCNKAKSLEHREKKSTQYRIYLISTGILIFDLQTYLFAGRATLWAHWMMRVASYALFLLKYMYITAFTMFLMKYTKQHIFTKKVLLTVSVIIGVIGMVCLSPPEVRENFYYIDEHNYLYYGRIYHIIRLFFIVDVSIMLIALLLEKNHYRKGTFYLYLGFIVNLLSLGFLDYFLDAWFLQDMAIFFSTMIIFIDNMMQVSDQWLNTQKQLIFTEYKASHDLMTELWNKASGMLQIKEYLATMSEKDAAVLGFVDIDDFKAVNDTYGHEVGDFWICEIAKALQAACDADDIVCRYGGDEYIVLMKNIKSATVLSARMEGFKAHVQKKSKERQQEVHCSIGLFQIKGANHSLEECVMQADALVYQAKNSGKDTYIIG